MGCSQSKNIVEPILFEDKQIQTEAKETAEFSVEINPHLLQDFLWNNETQTYIHETDRSIQTETNTRQGTTQTTIKHYRDSSTQHLMEITEDGTQTVSKSIEDKNIQSNDFDQYLTFDGTELLSLGENLGERLHYENEGFEDYQIEALFRHNFLRSFHPDTPPMVLNMKLCEEAKKGAYDQSFLNRTGHITDTHGAGENLHHTSAKADPITLAIEGIDAYYCEVDDYYGALDYATLRERKDWDKSKKIGHYTQLVWKDSNQLGIGFAAYTEFPKFQYRYIATCRYRPAGNVVMAWTGSLMSEKCSFPTTSLKEIKKIIEYHQCKKVTTLTEEKIFLKYTSKGITNWQIFGWKHFNTIRETQFLPLVMLDLDLCKQDPCFEVSCNYSLTSHSRILDEKMEGFVKDYLDNNCSGILLYERSRDWENRFTKIGFYLDRSDSMTTLRFRVS